MKWEIRILCKIKINYATQIGVSDGGVHVPSHANRDRPMKRHTLLQKLWNRAQINMQKLHKLFNFCIIYAIIG